MFVFWNSLLYPQLVLSSLAGNKGMHHHVQSLWASYKLGKHCASSAITHLFFETKCHSVARNDLKFTMYFKVSSNSLQSSCLTLPGAGITKHYHTSLINWKGYFFIFVYVYFYLYVCVCAQCACLVTIWVREDFRSPGTGATDVCKSSCGCWELNLGSIREQQVLLTDGHLSSSSLSNFKIWFLILCFCDYYYYYCASFCFVC